MKGKSMVSISMESCELGVEGAKAMAELVSVTASMTSLSTTHNKITGDGAQQLASAVLAKPTLENFSGIPLKELRADSLTALDLPSKVLGMPEAMVLADLLRSVTASVTKILVGGNYLRDEGTIILCDAMRGSTVSKVQELGLNSNGIGPDGAKAVAALCAAMASLTKVLVGGNELGDEGTIILCDALRESTATKVQELDLSLNRIGPEGAKAVAAMAAVVASLTRLDIDYNSLGEEGRAVLRKTVEVRSGFELKL